MSETSPEPPRKVALFSGHMIDARGRAGPRFPPDKEPIAAPSHRRGSCRPRGQRSRHLRRRVRRDPLFAEAALGRGSRFELYIPFEEPLFLEKSVGFAGGDWSARPGYAASCRST